MIIAKQKDLLFLLSLATLFFLLRLPSLFEPYWYGDEGIYHVIGDALRHGRLLYSQIWDNKPPLLYLLYALIDYDQLYIRLASIIFGLGACIAFFFTAKKLLYAGSKWIPYAITTFFAFLFATPFIEGNIANAENFMLFPLILAAYLVVHASITASETHTLNRQTMFNLFTAGVLVGIATLFKIVAIFDMSAFVMFLFAARSMNKSAASFKQLFIICVGFLLPLLVTSIFLVSYGIFGAFIEANFINNVSYVEYKNTFFIPQGLLIIKITILLIAVGFLLRYKAYLTRPLLFILFWFCFALFSTFFSHRPYTHYVLIFLPSFSLLIGALLAIRKHRLLLGVILIISLLLLRYNFNHFDYRKTMQYYTTFISYLRGTLSITSYQSFFDKNTPRDYQVAEYLKSRMKKGDTLFLWGNSPQIYTLSHTLPFNRYIVAYHIAYHERTLEETKEALAKNPPTYIVISSDYQFFPFTLDRYRYTLTIKDTAIYERVY